jgi:hypothetical protein
MEALWTDISHASVLFVIKHQHLKRSGVGIDMFATTSYVQAITVVTTWLSKARQGYGTAHKAQSGVRDADS